MSNKPKSNEKNLEKIINRVLAEKSDDPCELYSSAISAFLKEENNLDSRLREKLELIREICSFVFHPLTDNSGNLYGPMLVMGGQRTMQISDLTDDHLHLLGEAYDEIENLEIKARIADIMWIRKKDHKYALSAIKLFMSRATQLFETGKDPVSRTNIFKDKLVRALKLALEINHNDIRQEIANSLTMYLGKLDARTENAYMLNHLTGMAIENGEKNLAPFKDKILEIIKVENSDFHTLRDLYELLSSVYKAEKNVDASNEALKDAAETWVSLAEAVLQSENPSYMQCAGFIDAAIKAYNPISSSYPDRIKELRKLLRGFNQKSISEMKKVEAPIDTSLIEKQAEEILQKINNTSKNDIVGALSIFCSYPIVSKKTTFDHAEKLATSAPLYSLMNKKFIDENGKQMDGDDTVEIQAYQNLHLNWGLSSLRIEKIRKHIFGSFSAEEIQSAFQMLIDNNPILSKKRYEIVFQALLAGSLGNWIVSSHIIPGQIEHIIRERLDHAGEYAFKPKMAKGGAETQHDHNINEFFSGVYLQTMCKDEYFDENVMFNLHGLLTHKYGANLRNNVYHGLTDSEGFYNPANIYLWWLFLKILVHAKVISEQHGKR